MNVVVAADALTKRYGNRTVVNDVSFDVRAGEVVGLLGPNGSGKSTILRILTGYLVPTAGSARVGGFDVVAQSRAARSCVGYVPEDVPLYPHMRVDESLSFMGRMRGLDGKALAHAIDAACDRLGLRTVRDLAITKLSRGYRQRVAIAQSVLHRPQLLVLDEPTNGLDPRQIIELRGLVRDLARTCAVLVTSHVLSEIERVAHRVAILMDGRLLRMHALDNDRSHGAGWWQLRLRAPCADILGTLLADTPGVVSARMTDAADDLSHWHVRVRDSGVLEYLAQTFSQGRIGLLEMSPVSSDLEALFLELTAAQAAGHPARAMQ
jgi:ABC-2 type transport system ATP-binding protein